MEKGFIGSKGVGFKSGSGGGVEQNSAQVPSAYPALESPSGVSANVSELVMKTLFLLITLMGLMQFFRS